MFESTHYDVNLVMSGLILIILILKVIG